MAAAAPWAVFIALVGVLLGPSLTGDRVAVPHDLLYEFLPWSADRPAHGAVGARNPELRDVIDQYYPGQHELVSRMLGGRDASWLPEVALGYPGWVFLGWGALSPFNVPAALMPFELAWSWSMALRLLAAMGGAYVLGRGFGMGRAGATVAGVAYGLCGYMVGWLGWPQSHVGALLPWVWAAVRLCARPTRPLWAVPAVAFATAGLWLAGFPSVALWGIVGAGIVGLHATWAHREE
ncbi:MAG TPA: hypothetical protein VM287_07995, partial [Egibacteraceae bacterium]|nr:hypothetical protein [Egibacteraceae bacterium]